MAEHRYPWFKAVLRNAVTWGAAWAVAGGAIATVLGLFNAGPGVESLIERVGVAVLNGMGWGVRFGIVGGVMGTAFATAIRLRYRGRRLADISPVRFALLGAVVGGVGVPLYLQTMNVLFGDGLVAWNLVSDDALICSVFGAAAAAGSIMLARRAESLAPAPDPELLEPAVDVRNLPEGQPEISRSQRSQSGKA